DSRRHDLLHTLAAFGQRHWPGRAEVGFLDFLHAAQPLFRAYLDLDRKTQGAGMLAAPAFNPLDHAAIERLRHWRQLVLDGIGACLEPCGEEQRLCRASATRLLDQVPSLYAGSHSVCAIVQPQDGSGTSWVLNRLFEGSGWLSSRYTAVMDEEVRERWTAYYTARSVREQDGEMGELVDLNCTLGHSLNIHALQTRRVLEVPGESSPAPPGRSIRFRDLRIQLPGPDRYPRLVDAASRRLLPVHLGGRGFRFLPELLKLLVLLGPGELRPCLPRKGARREGDVLIGDRHLTGSVVFARRTWTFDAGVLRSRLERATDAQAFLAVNDWRLERGFPDRVFLAEPVGSGAGPPRLKPQYIDFTSPLFVEIFRSAVQAGPGELGIAEALPDPEGLLRGEDGKRWAVEIQLDNLDF
ncbi:MAG TPA: hypothetical protein VMW27_25690, partial [Thermoanaerobaculia bacterium]|nr:hypothetical protein [Thermoanaerobaculia bacterium]